MPETTDAIVIAEKLEGIKDSATNTVAMKEAEAQAEAPKIEEVKFPSYFVDPTEHVKIEIDILFDKKIGKILSITQKGALTLTEENLKGIGHKKESFSFTQPMYDDMALYRQRCTVYNNQAEKAVIDSVALRNFIIVWHLKEWSMTDATGKVIKLDHEDNGSLTNESLAQVYKMFPAIIDVVMTLLEKQLMLT